MPEETTTSLRSFRPSAAGLAAPAAAACSPAALSCIAAAGLRACPAQSASGLAAPLDDVTTNFRSTERAFWLCGKKFWRPELRATHAPRLPDLHWPLAPAAADQRFFLFPAPQTVQAPCRPRFDWWAAPTMPA
ncbi:hypothetical protein ABPG77_003226 [Micractinium sp. CCAP 211/92]